MSGLQQQRPASLASRKRITMGIVEGTIAGVPT